MKFGMAAVASVIPACTVPAILHLATSQPGGDVFYTQPPDHYADYQWNQEQPGSNSGLYFLVSFYPTVRSLTVGVMCRNRDMHFRTTKNIYAFNDNQMYDNLSITEILCWLTSTPHLLPKTGGYIHTINSTINRKWPKLELELTMITYL